MATLLAKTPAKAGPEGFVEPDVRDGRILIIDDQELNLALLEMMLRKAGYRRIETSSDPRRAIELYERFRPDVLVLDIEMPHLNGFEVMEALHELEDSRSYLPILVLTGHDDPDIRMRALESGAKDFLNHPLNEAEVLSRIRNLIQVRQLQNHLRSTNRQLEAEVQRRTVKLENAIAVLKQAEGKLTGQVRAAASLSQAKSEFLANMSHELRTPLNAIMGFSEILKNELLGGLGHDKYREYAGDIHVAASHLLGVIDDILDLSRAEAGKLDLDIREIPAQRVVDASVMMLQEAAKAAGVTIRVDIAEDFPMLRTDERRLRQVLLNILSNAVKFTPEGGEITVLGRHDPADGAMIFVVSDTGIGIAPEDVAKALSPYGQAHNPQVRKHRGTGLGLPLTKRLVESLGGEFSLDSKVGLGTAVTIRFPPHLVVATPQA